MLGFGKLEVSVPGTTLDEPWKLEGTPVPVGLLGFHSTGGG